VSLPDPKIGEHVKGGFRFPLLLTHEEMASMACTTREINAYSRATPQGWVDFD